MIPRRISWDTLNAVLALGVAPLPALLARHYGARAGLRAALALAGALAVQESFLAMNSVLRRPPGYADALTLSRAAAAAILAAVTVAGVRDRAGTAGWLSWLALLWGETVSDWLDGPLARRAESSSLGARLDLEADSWLTLWAAIAAVRWGELPRCSVAAPATRYAVALLAAGDEAPWHTWWARTAGVTQMAMLTAALSPYKPRWLSTITRRAAAPVAVAQLVCLGAQGAVILRGRRRGE